LEIKETVLELLNDSQAPANEQRDPRFTHLRKVLENLPAQALSEAKSEYPFTLAFNSLQELRKVLKLALVLVFQDAFLRGLRLAKTPNSLEEHLEDLSISTYYKALKAYPDLEETTAEAVKMKLLEVEPLLQQIISLPEYIDPKEKQLVFSALAQRTCNKLLDFAILAGKVCSEKSEQSKLQLL